MRNAAGSDVTIKAVESARPRGAHRDRLPPKLRGLSRDGNCRARQALLDFVTLLVEWERAEEDPEEKRSDE